MTRDPAPRLNRKSSRRWPRRYAIVASALFAVLILAVIGGYSTQRERLPVSRAGPLIDSLPAGNELRLFVIGDSGSGNEDQWAVADAMEQRCRNNGVDAIAHVGDVFYPIGVDSVDDPKWQRLVLAPYGGECLRPKPILSVFGNHDYNGSAEAEIQFARSHPRWLKPFRFYSRTFGDLLEVIAFDSWYPDFCLDASNCAVDFLLERLSRRRTHWRIVVTHYPIESASRKRGPGVRGWLLRQLLCRGDVDAVFSGHNHHLEHREIEGCAPSVFIVGGGGAPLYPVDDNDPASRFVRSAFGFAEVELNAARMVVRLIGADSAVLYEFAKPGRPAPEGGYR